MQHQQQLVHRHRASRATCLAHRRHTQPAMPVGPCSPVPTQQQRAVPCSTLLGAIAQPRAQRRVAVRVVAEPPSPQAKDNEAAKADSQPHAEKFKDALLLQGFGWDSHAAEGGGKWYDIVKAKVDDIKAAGFTHIWLPPPSASVAPQGYLPAQLYDLDSNYGSKKKLIALNKALKAAGIKPVADIVINHRCADEQQDGVWNKFRDDVDHDYIKLDWGRWAITSNDPHFKGSGNPDTGDDFHAAPDLDHLNPDLRAALKDWMTHLKDDIGFEGFRFDYVKGYAPRFIDEYVAATTTQDVLNVGELWTDMHWEDGQLGWNQDGARQALCNWIDESNCPAFDFPLKGVLQEAVKNVQYNRLRDKDGKSPGLIGWWPAMAVTFVDNHDTGSSQAHWPFPGELVPAGYAYILTHPGVPTVFWEHLFDWGSEVRGTIEKLIQLRKDAGITSVSKLEILCADADMYVARIDGRVLLKMGPRCEMGDLVPKEEDGWSFVVSGRDFAVWQKKK